MAGRRQAPTISRRDFWNAGKRTAGKCIPSGKALPAQKLSPRQTAQHRLSELSGSSARGLFSAIYVVTEHPCHHTVAAQEVDLEAMCLLLCARFRIDTADVFFRLRVGTFSVLHYLLK